MSKTFYVVWNADRSEGFLTDDAFDAEQVLNGECNSVAGHAFWEAYGDDDLHHQVLEI